jgi:hypothetical protein
MQTKNYGDLFTFIQALIGAGTLTVPECRIIHQFINQRLQEAYNTTQSWPRYLVSSEERILYGILTSGISASDSHSNSYYYFLGNDSNGNAVYKSKNTHSTNHFIFYYVTSSNKWRLGKIPTSDLTVDSSGVVSYTNITTLCQSETTNDASPLDVKSWENIGGTTGTLDTDAKSIILFDDTDGNDIGEFIRIYRKKAFLNQSQLEYDFFLDIDGAHILNVANSNDNKGFVTYKKRQDFLTITEGGTPNASNYTDNTSVQVPLEFYNFIANGAHADFLRVERRFEEALQADNKAQNYLAQELEKLDIIANNNNLKKKFSTHLNRNSR